MHERRYVFLGADHGGTDQPALYDGFLDPSAEAADAERLLAFRLPAEKQARLDRLLRKYADGSLSVDETREFEEFERLEHFGRMLKARLRQKHRQYAFGPRRKYGNKSPKNMPVPHMSVGECSDIVDVHDRETP